MSTNTYPLKLPASIKAAAQRLAKEDGVSLNQWIASAVAQKIGVVETAAEFLNKKAGDATANDFLKSLENVPDHPPMKGDEPPRKLVEDLAYSQKRFRKCRIREHNWRRSYCVRVLSLCFKPHQVGCGRPHCFHSQPKHIPS